MSGFAKLAIALALCVTLDAYAGPLKVAVVDTGLNVANPLIKDRICGTKDLTGEGIYDIHGHGTNVVGLIAQYAGSSDYCMLIIKYYSESAKGTLNEERLATALNYAAAAGASIVNVSAGGPSPDAFERLTIESNPGVRFMVAAGNENHNISEVGYFPAGYGLPNIFPVGSITAEGGKAPSSNWGAAVQYWEVGVEARGILGGPMTGTSQATAIATGKLIAGKLQKKSAPAGYGCNENFCQRGPHKEVP